MHACYLRGGMWLQTRQEIGRRVICNLATSMTGIHACPYGLLGLCCCFGILASNACGCELLLSLHDPTCIPADPKARECPLVVCTTNLAARAAGWSRAIQVLGTQAWLALTKTLKLKTAHQLHKPSGVCLGSWVFCWAEGRTNLSFRMPGLC